ncbi:secretory carrier membrane protein isoform X2 [Xylocopa sonorina]|uniref:secretory carrier membrane protein isoform X2 n=1 Tax=Xylocopa sonorina TaxID=1818115 RepID=UPI00403A8DE6
MSGFDENPFGEPNTNDPFADPAIRRAVSSTPTNRGLEDYNPFADQGSQGMAQVRGASNPPIYGGLVSTQQPATLQPSNQEPPATNYARTPQQTVNPPLASPLPPTSDINQRSEPEWKPRPDEDIRNTSYYCKNNWPPLPDKCCFQPCFHQDIDVEIHSDFQKVVRQLYRLWMFHGCILILNVIGGFFVFLCDGGFSTFGLGILYLILFTPFSFLCWFRPAYKAFKNDSSFNFMVFFFVFFFQLIVTSIQAIGIPGSGTCGIIVAITMFNSTAKGVFVGMLLLFIAICFVLAACGDLLLLTKIHRIYRSSDASISKAQQEFATTFLRDEHVQAMTSNVAASAARQHMANVANQPRY